MDRVFFRPARLQMLATRVLRARHLHQAIPTTATRHQGLQQCEEEVGLAAAMVHHLERLSLVNFSDPEGVRRVGEAVRLAAKVVAADTDCVAPLHSTLELEALPLRPDAAVTPQGEAVVEVAAVTEEGYYVAPQGNVPLAATRHYGRKEVVAEGVGLEQKKMAFLEWDKLIMEGVSENSRGCPGTGTAVSRTI